MISAIEQIVSADESARNTVESAEKKAEQLLAEARAKAADLLTELEALIHTREENEITPILADAQKQAKKTMEQAEGYIEELKTRVALRQTGIIDNFILIVSNKF